MCQPPVPLTRGVPKRLLDDVMPGRFQRGNRPFATFFLDQYVVGIKCGECKNAYLCIRQYPGDLGQYTDQRKVEHGLYPKSPPAVVARDGCSGHAARAAHQRYLFVGFAEKTELVREIHFGYARHLAQRKLLLNQLQNQSDHPFLCYSSCIIPCLRGFG